MVHFLDEAACVRLDCFPFPCALYCVVLDPYQSAIIITRFCLCASACSSRARVSFPGEQLKESSMKINGVKAGISVNEKKINSLLKMVVTS